MLLRSIYRYVMGIIILPQELCCRDLLRGVDMPALVIWLGGMLQCQHRTAAGHVAICADMTDSCDSLLTDRYGIKQTAVGREQPVIVL